MNEINYLHNTREVPHVSHQHAIFLFSPVSEWQSLQIIPWFCKIRSMIFFPLTLTIILHCGSHWSFPKMMNSNLVRMFNKFPPPGHISLYTTSIDWTIWLAGWLILDSKYIVCCHVLLQLALSTECSQLLPLYYKPFFVIPVVPIERTEKCCLFGVTTIIHRYFTPFYRYQCLPSFICMSIYSLFNMNYLKNASLQVNWICISFDIVCYKRAKCL